MNGTRNSIVYRGAGRVKVFPAVNRCIYCGSVEGALTDEHIIPFALGGNMILPKASCQTCQRIINEQAEQPILDATRGMLGISRGRLGLPSRSSRRGKKIRDVKPFIIVTRANGEKYRKEIDQKAFPLVLNAFESGPPGFVYESIGNFEWVPGTEIFPILNDHHGELQKFAGPGESVTTSIVFAPAAFLRMIAKISHALTVALIGYDAFDPYLPSIILGRDDRCFHFIGSQPVNEFSNEGLHELSVMGGIPNMGLIDQPIDTEHVCANVRLFCRYGMPEYLAVVGKLRGTFEIIASL